MAVELKSIAEIEIMRQSALLVSKTLGLMAEMIDVLQQRGILLAKLLRISLTIPLLVSRSDTLKKSNA